MPEAGSDEEDYPVRQGDLFAVPEGLGIRVPPWTACQVVHPTCEFVKRSLSHFQVIGVYNLGTINPEHQEKVVAGEELVEDKLRVALAHTFFLPPPDGFTEPMYSNFREIALVPREALVPEHRIAALSHEARVYFIRRKLYWEQRWALEIAATFKLEAQRIGSDANFKGPKPEWATTS